MPWLNGRWIPEVGASPRQSRPARQAAAPSKPQLPPIAATRALLAEFVADHAERADLRARFARGEKIEPAEPTYTRRDGRFWTTRYFDGLERRGVIVKGSASKVADMIEETEPGPALGELGLRLQSPDSFDHDGARRHLVEAARALGTTPREYRPDPRLGSARRFLNPEYPAPERPETPLRGVLKALGLSDHHVGKLHDALIADVSGEPEPAGPRGRSRGCRGLP